MNQGAHQFVPGLGGICHEVVKKLLMGAEICGLPPEDDVHCTNGLCEPKENIVKSLGAVALLVLLNACAGSHLATGPAMPDVTAPVEKSLNVPCPDFPMEVTPISPYVVRVKAIARATVKSWQVSEEATFTLVTPNEIELTGTVPGTYNAIAHVRDWQVCGIAIFLLPNPPQPASVKAASCPAFPIETTVGEQGFDVSAHAVTDEPVSWSVVPAPAYFKRTAPNQVKFFGSWGLNRVTARTSEWHYCTVELNLPQGS